MNKYLKANPHLQYCIDYGKQQIFHSDPKINIMGIGFRKTNGITTNEICLSVGVENKLPPNQVAAMIPSKIVVPNHGDVKVDVVEKKQIFVHDANLQKRGTPIQPGFSLGHPNITAGTLGAILYDETRWQYILSNNHVMADINNASIGDPILQPGPFDGGQPQDAIATLSDFINIAQWPTANLVDCALAVVNRTIEITKDIYGLGVVTGTNDAFPGMRVKKAGRTTGVTYGYIELIDAAAGVNYGTEQNPDIKLFVDQISTNAMSLGGDSGSILLDEGNRVVGLLFAGSDEDTIFNDINHVISALNLERFTWN